MYLCTKLKLLIWNGRFLCVYLTTLAYIAEDTTTGKTTINRIEDSWGWYTKASHWTIYSRYHSFGNSCWFILSPLLYFWTQFPWSIWKSNKVLYIAFYWSPSTAYIIHYFMLSATGPLYREVRVGLTMAWVSFLQVNILHLYQLNLLLFANCMYYVSVFKLFNL